MNKLIVPFNSSSPETPSLAPPRAPFPPLWENGASFIIYYLWYGHVSGGGGVEWVQWKGGGEACRSWAPATAWDLDHYQLRSVVVWTDKEFEGVCAYECVCVGVCGMKVLVCVCVCVKRLIWIKAKMFSCPDINETAIGKLSRKINNIARQNWEKKNCHKQFYYSINNLNGCTLRPRVYNEKE